MVSIVLLAWLMIAERPRGSTVLVWNGYASCTVPSLFAFAHLSSIIAGTS
jgi:hypothetical protein